MVFTHLSPFLYHYDSNKCKIKKGKQEIVGECKIVFYSVNLYLKYEITVKTVTDFN